MIEIYIADNLVRQGCVGDLKLAMIARICEGLVGRDVIEAVGGGTGRKGYHGSGRGRRGGR